MNRSFVDILNTIGAVIVIIVIAFAVYTLFIDKPFYKASSYWNWDEGTSIGTEEDSGTYIPEGSIDELEIKNVSGLVEAESWNKDYVQLDYIKKGPGKPPEIKTDIQGTRLKIAAVYPKSPGNFGSVDFYLKVPENLAYLKAGTVSGRINISGLTEATTQDLSSTSGSVTTTASGDLEISSVSGSLDFSSSGRRINASTTSGRISGVIEESFPDSRIEISSVSGSVKLKAPSDFSADVNLHSVSGGVSSEIPVSVTETKRNRIQGSIGDGSADLEISTVSGSIKIIK